LNGPARRALEIASWALYDFANTLFSLNVLSYHFPLWLTVGEGMSEARYSLLLAAASLVSAAALPVAGFLSDRTGSRRAPLAALTTLCVVSTALIGTGPPASAVLFFVLANVFYHASQILYNAQLVGLSDPGRWGFVSGLGVATGYLGTIVGVFFSRPFFEAGGHRAVFLPTAAFFLVFALPCLAFCVDREKAPEAPRGGWRFWIGYDPVRTGREIGRSPALRSFTAGSFLLLNVTAVIILFMTVFARKAAGLSEAETERMILGASTAAMAGAVAWGALYDRLGKAAVLRSVPVLWVLVFALNAGYRWKACFFGAALAAGFSLGATWSVTRAYVLELVSVRRVGEYYGVLGFLGRVGTLTGPLIVWGALAGAEGFSSGRYDALNAVLLGLAALAAACFWGVKGRDA
jgi:UMF1 family MFS transporter